MLLSVVCSTSQAAQPARPLDAATVLARYADALAAVKRPPAVEFEYSVEQLGPHNLEQTHHVYRSSEGERDEITGVNGESLTRPSVRILMNRAYPYDIRSVAPREAEYRFIYTGTILQAADHFVYMFKTEPLGLVGNFEVDEVELDGTTFLPSAVHFKIAGGETRGSGQLTYGKFDKYWLVREATVSVHMPDGQLAQEHIAWSKYQFPPSLPDSTFKEAPPAPAVPGG